MLSKGTTEKKYFIHEWLPGEAQKVKLDSKFSKYEGSFKNIIFAIHGLGGNGSWFDSLAKDITSSGIAFFSYDLRGFGKSEFKIGHVNSFKDWINDSQKLYDSLKENYPNSKITILGHSLGASIGVNIKIAPEDNLILSVPGFKGERNKWDLRKFIIPTLFKIIFSPNTYVKLPEPEPDNPTLGDPLRVSSVSAKLIGQILCLNKSIKFGIDKVRNPILVIKVKKDEVVCNKTIDKRYAKIKSKIKSIYTADVEHHDWIWYPVRSAVAQKIIDWVKNT